MTFYYLHLSHVQLTQHLAEEGSVFDKNQPPDCKTVLTFVSIFLFSFIQHLSCFSVLFYKLDKLQQM